VALHAVPPQSKPSTELASNAAPVPRRVREKWLERLFNAVQEDDPPYIESLGEHWGALCADPALASHWADQLVPLVRHVMADRSNGTYAYSRSGTLCFSALFRAGRFDELLTVLALDPKPYWHDQQWAAKVLVVRGDVGSALKLIEGLRSALRAGQGAVRAGRASADRRRTSR
jgi:hypothetical protein